MKLNLDFYQDELDSGISSEDRKSIDLWNEVKNSEEILEKDSTVNSYFHLSNVKENLLNWYNFKENSSGLEIGSGFGELSRNVI